MDKSNVCRSVRIVFYCGNAPGNAIFIPFEIDNTILALMTATVMTNSNLTLIVTASFFAQRLQKRFFRLVSSDFSEIGNRHASATVRGRLIVFDRHFYSLLFL